MKVSYNWLKEHLPLDLSAADLSSHLLRLGFEVVSSERKGAGFSGVVTGHILEISKHPNADRLSLCVVDDGKEKLSVVCGAQNIAVGQKVPLARVGAQLPGGFKITKSKIRGVESNGMICSSSELGLAGANGGILVLDPGSPVGADFAATLGPGDEIMDVEITPNRPDCLSHRGLARELAAFFRYPLKSPEMPKLPAPQGTAFPVRVDDALACPRYLGRVFSNLEIGPSPAWLAARLEAVGLRPINNLVDITNFILMDIGQPLHAFDMDKLEGGEIRVRWAAAGEKFKALDGKDYALNPGILVIADAKRPQAVAGVMGGAESGVTEKTKRAFLESAHFSPSVVRKASQSLRLRSDASYRFERGTDIAAVDAASARAAELIFKHCGREVKFGPLSEAGSKTTARPPIIVTTARINAILGSQFESSAVEGTLKAISASLKPRGEELVFEAPSWRGDLETPWDLAEETARLLSYDSIPARTPTLTLKPARLTRSQTIAARCRSRLAGMGLLEAYNYDFISDKQLSSARIAPSPHFARLANPVSEDWTILRPTLLIGLLQNAALNFHRGAQAARLFELGKAYTKTNSGISERQTAAGALYGAATNAFWKPARTPTGDFYDTLGVVADLLSGTPGLVRAPFNEFIGGAGDELYNPSASARFKTPRGLLATVGELHPQAARAFDLERQGVTLFEIDLEQLAELEAIPFEFRPFSAFPFVRRDLSVVAVRKHAYGILEAAARAAAGENLLALELIDVFEGKNVPQDKRSLTLRLTFSRSDRTLKDVEVNAAMDSVIKALQSKFGAELRG